MVFFMVKCSSCGLEFGDGLENCPNCGKRVVKSDPSEEPLLKCTNCGKELEDGIDFCPSCGNKVEKEDNSLKCSNCGSQIPENTLFCPTCGNKVNRPKAETRTCINCGYKLESDEGFCPECGVNLTTGKTISKNVEPTSFLDKVKLENIVKPTIVALVSAILLSLIGLLIGFSWYSFIIAIILAVGFFAGIIDNEANAIVFGLIVGIILGLLETPLVEFMYGAFVAGFYEGFFGGHLVILVILGVIVAYISNVYLKENILDIVDKFKSLL